MIDNPKIAVTTINYNSIDNLSNLLKKIFSQKIGKNTLAEKNLQVWLIDNDSPDQGGAQLKKEFPKLNFIQSKENGGFAKGHNLALKKINADFILIINPDVEIEDDAIEKMVQFMQQNPDCGVASCKLIFPNQTIQANGGDLPFGLSLLTWLFNLEMIPGLEKLTGNFHRADKEYYHNTHEVGWVGGTFMFLKSEVLKKVGFLPEDYFMYFEDADYCYQAQKKGFKVMINPGVSVVHYGGASSKDPRLAQFKGEVIGLEIFYQKYFDQFTARIVKFLLFVSILFRIVAFMVVGKPVVAQTYWRILPYV